MQHLVQLCFGMVLGFAKNFARAISKVLHKLFHLKNSEHPCSVTRKEGNVSSFLWQYTPLHYRFFCFCFSSNSLFSFDEHIKWEYPADCHHQPMETTHICPFQEMSCTQTKPLLNLLWITASILHANHCIRTTTVQFSPRLFACWKDT